MHPQEYKCKADTLEISEFASQQRLAMIPNKETNLLPLRRMLRGLSSGLSLLLLIGSTGLASAQSQGQSTAIGVEIGNALTETLENPRAYTPPEDDSQATGNSTGGGIRGCGQEMIAIAPQLTHVGQSFSTRPTVVWYMGNTTTGTLKFALYQDGEDISAAPTFSEELELPQSGYVAYTLPDGSELTVGETYTWRALLYCNGTLGKWITADIQIVAPPEGESIPEATSDRTLEDATAYAALGYWYDALALVYDAETAEEAVLRQNLLLDLADLEAGSESAIATHRSNRLKMLAETP